MPRPSTMAKQCLCVLLAAAVLATACDKGDAAKTGGGDASPGAVGASGAAPAPAGQAKDAPVFRMTPEQYVAEFKSAGWEAQQAKYQKGYVELAGVVDGLFVNFAGDPAINLKAGQVTPATATTPEDRPLVQCLTVDPQPWAKVARGQTVTLRGSVGPLPSFPSLAKCEVITAGPATVTAVTSKELAGEYAKGAGAAMAKYKDKDLIVGGKVVERQADVTGTITLFLEGDGATRVRCFFDITESTMRPDAPAVKVGQDVKVFGELKTSASTPPADVAPLSGCRLVK